MRSVFRSSFYPADLLKVRGEEHGAGWVAYNLPNFETIRVTWARMRNQKNYKREQQYKEVFAKKN